MTGSNSGSVRSRVMPAAWSRAIRNARRGWRAAIKAYDEIDTRVIAMEPAGRTDGRVLLSYITSPFLLRSGAPIPHSHPHYWESHEMAQAFLELGYAVDVIHFKNQEFVPAGREYSVVVDARKNLERLAPMLAPECVKIMHIDTSHLLFHNAAEARRLLELKERRGIALRPRRFEMPNLGIEHADAATVLGSEFSMDTFRYAGKPLYRLPLPFPVQYPWPETKDFEKCRRNFLWLGSGGMVHKGLDRVLDAFATMPECRLTVCGPVQKEKDFERAYRRELYELPNIRTVGWVDINSQEFQDILNDSLALVYPSCSEGAAGSVIGCMHAGLIPVVSREAAVYARDDHAVVLQDSTVEEIRAAVADLAARPPAALQAMAHTAWEEARAQHTREHFAREYRAAIRQILQKGA